MLKPLNLSTYFDSPLGEVAALLEREDVSAESPLHLKLAGYVVVTTTG